jgi:hypothetical protein
MTSLYDLAMNGGRLRRFIVVFAAAFTLAGLMFLAVSLLLVPLGLTLSSAIGGAIGCGIGTALVNATYILFWD